MENLNLNNKIIKIGNTEFNKNSFEGMTKDEFKKLYRGKLAVDLDDAWKQIKPKNRVKKSTSKKDEESFCLVVSVPLIKEAEKLSSCNKIGSK